MTPLAFVLTVLALSIALGSLIYLASAAAESDRLGTVVGGALIVTAFALGTGAALAYDESLEVRRDYALYCVDGAAVVVNETYCEKGPRPGEYWLWIGAPVTPPVPERFPAPPRGVLVDCTDRSARELLELGPAGDLPPNGATQRAFEVDLRELGVVR